MKAEIACVIDRSGSMDLIRSDAIGGFNSFLNEQKVIPGECKFTLVLFDNEILTLHDRVDIGSVAELNLNSYVPRGTTALYDAVGQTIIALGAKLDSSAEKPDKVIFIILTDGQENASKEYSMEKISELIKHQTEKYSWEFVFLAANQDAFYTGNLLNISANNTVNFAADSAGIRGAYASMSGLSTSYRTGVA